MKCKKFPEHYNEINGVLFHVLFLFTILSLLFIFYISQGSAEAINGIINKSINNINFSKYDPSKVLKTIFKEVTNKDYDSLITYFKNNKDPFTESINSTVKEEMLMVIFSIILLIIMYNLLPISLVKYCTNLSHLFIELFFYFIIVIFIELWFFNTIASKYVPVEPSYLNSYINKKIILLFNKNE